MSEPAPEWKVGAGPENAMAQPVMMYFDALRSSGLPKEICDAIIMNFIDKWNNYIMSLIIKQQEGV